MLFCSAFSCQGGSRDDLIMMSKSMCLAVFQAWEMRADTALGSAICSALSLQSASLDTDAHACKAESRRLSSSKWPLQ